LPLAAIAAVLCLAAAVGANACSIPVFRYALERWAASPYQVIIFQKGDKGVVDGATADRLAKLNANAEFRTIDVNAAMDDLDAALWKAQPPTAELPWAVVRFPESGPKLPSLWEGKFDPTAIADVLDSPARREVAKRLIAGESCVWVLLGGKDKPADDSVAESLEKYLTRQQGQIKLPEIAFDGPQLKSTLPLRVAFSIVRVRPDDPREAAFVRMLKMAEPQFADTDEALVIPVIGRGRAISALPASRATEDRVEAFAEFICGQCSCEVKEQNPGIDLLMAADWDVIFADGADPAERPQPRESTAGKSVPIPVNPGAAPAATQPAPAIAAIELQPASNDSGGWALIGIPVAAVLAIVSGAVAIRGRRKAP
jgi:hypothetical protein